MLGGGVRPASQPPPGRLVFECVTCFYCRPKTLTLFKTKTEWKSRFSLKKCTQFKTRVPKPYRVCNQNGQNRYPVYDQNGCKTPLFTAEHSHIAHKGSNPSPGCVWCIFIQSKTNLQFITVRQDSSRVCDLKLLFYRKHTEDVMLVVFSQLINGRKLNVWWRKRRGTIPFNWNANFILTDKQEVI